MSTAYLDITYVHIQMDSKSYFRSILSLFMLQNEFKWREYECSEKHEMNLTDTSFHLSFQITGFLLAYIRSCEFLLSWHIVLNFMSMLL